MNIGIDIDNVISNFNDVLLEEFLKHDKELRNTGIVDNSKYISRGMFDWSELETKEFYNSNIERIAINLDLVNDAKKYIDKLKTNGNRIIIITGRNNGEYSEPYQMTKDWLFKQGINYDKLILTNAYKHHEKADICLEENIDIMVDDSVHVCEECLNKNIKSILFGTPYNKQEMRFKRMDNWNDIYNYINNNKFNVILDTDTYNECDDQFALTYLLKSQDIFNIEAITIAPYSHQTGRNVSVIDGQENSYNEVLKICNWLNFDVTNKVFKGSMDYIQNGYDKNNDAVNKIIEVSLKNNKTYILAIGAITNIALAIKKEPSIISKIEIIWLGGNDLYYKDNREYNFRQDIEAVKVVFDSKAKLTIIPCKEVASVLKTDINTLNMNLKDKSELCNYLIERFYNDGYHGIQESRVIWDISVIAYMINPNWFKTEEISCPNILENTSYEITQNKHSVTFITSVNKNKIYEDLFRKLGD